MGRNGRPQVVAHRGASAVKAEHTLDAYLAAIEEGAEALECDVRLTADGHLVCVHDRDLRRTAQTPGLISTTTLTDLDALDFASWKNPWADLDDEAPEVDPDKRSVLTLRRLLETVADADRRIEVAIETKHPTRYGGLVERRLVALLEEFGWTGADGPVRVMSFSWLALRRIERLAPELDVVYLMDRAGAWGRARPVAAHDWIAGPGVELLREHPRSMRRLAASTPMHVWTVNTAEDVELCVETGVRAIITDRPGFVRRHLDSMLGPADVTDDV